MQNKKCARKYKNCIFPIFAMFVIFAIFLYFLCFLFGCLFCVFMFLCFCFFVLFRFFTFALWSDSPYEFPFKILRAMWRGYPIPISPVFFTQYPQIYTNFLSISSSTGNFSIPNLHQKCCNPQIFLKPIFGHINDPGTAILSNKCAF